jgi:hypothetical protein
MHGRTSSEIVPRNWEIIGCGSKSCTVLADCERAEQSWECDAEKVTSDVHSRNSSHGFCFQRFQPSRRATEKYKNSMYAERIKVVRFANK